MFHINTSPHKYMQAQLRKQFTTSQHCLPVHACNSQPNDHVRSLCIAPTHRVWSHECSRLLRFWTLGYRIQAFGLMSNLEADMPKFPWILYKRLRIISKGFGSVPNVAPSDSGVKKAWEKECCAYIHMCALAYTHVFDHRNHPHVFPNLVPMHFCACRWSNHGPMYLQQHYLSIYLAYNLFQSL